MPDMKSKARLPKLFAVLGLISLGACHVDPSTQNPIELVNSHTFDHANWQQVPSKVENQVEPITFVHSVAFEPGTTELSEAESSRLLAFLEASGIHEGARIEIDGPRSQGGYFDPVTAARVAGIGSELSSVGLNSQVPTRPMTSLFKRSGAISVSVTRAVAILPDCEVPQPEPATRPAYTFSCSNTALLGMMVADPLDLARGRNEGPSDGETAARVIQRYREREPSGYGEETQ